MNQDYVDTVRLLLAVAPLVFKPSHFALKGGTALNLFVQDMPRLSVDLDVVFTDYTLDRESALQAIGADLSAAKSAISAMGYRAVLPTTKQDRLITHLPGALTASHRDFLLSLVRAEPAWELMPFKHMPQLPALQWKLLNLRKLRSRNAGRFAAQHDELAASFKNLPLPRESPA